MGHVVVAQIAHQHVLADGREHAVDVALLRVGEVDVVRDLVRDKPLEGHETFESTEELRAVYPNAELLINIAEIQMAQATDDLGRGHSFVSHDRQHWWGTIVSPALEEKDE